MHLRRPWPGDRGIALASTLPRFPPFWRADPRRAARRRGATPPCPFPVGGADGAIAGYAVTGRRGVRGYMQRLAVHTAHEGHGLGAALVLDGLRWLHKRKVQQAVVNTQSGNERALASTCGSASSSSRSASHVLERPL